VSGHEGLKSEERLSVIIVGCHVDAKSRKCTSWIALPRGAEAIGYVDMWSSTRRLFVYKFKPRGIDFQPLQIFRLTMLRVGLSYICSG
jgi:hypothetical protein